MNADEARKLSRETGITPADDNAATAALLSIYAKVEQAAKPPRRECSIRYRLDGLSKASIDKVRDTLRKEGYTVVDLPCSRSDPHVDVSINW